MKHLFLRIVLLLGLLIVTFTEFIAVFRIPDRAMYPALADGDLLICLRHSEIRRNDLILYHDPDRQLHVGRVICGKGETFSMDPDGYPTVNGLRLRGSSTCEPVTSKPSIALPVTVATEGWIVLNDDLSHSEDSRTYGVIEREDVLGKLIFLFRRRGF